MDFSLFLPNMAKIWSQYWKLFLFTGLKNTLILTFISVALGTVLGTLVAMLKMSKSKILRFIASVYVEVLRGTPILLQLYVFYFVLPNIFKFMKLSQFMWVSISLCINSSAYVSEVIRSGIQAVDKGQTEAARSLGLSEGQTMVKIILPQAVRNILPALGNEFIMMLKETSLASTFFLGDIMTSYLVVKGVSYLTLEPLTIVAIIYLCVTYPLSKIVYAGIAGAGRALGYVCAPSMFQKVIASCVGQTGDVELYKKNRDLLYDGLTKIGYECFKPQGAFYMFVKTLEPDGATKGFGRG